MIAIVDYGVGNLFSLKSSFAAIGEAVTVSAEKEVLLNADRLLLPGVGAFADAANKLRDTGLDRTIKEFAASGKPLLGICLGMQLLFDESHEYGIHPGLGLIPGKVKPIAGAVPREYKIPHIGWNALQITKENPLLQGGLQDQCVYFVHSYFAADCQDAVIATTQYGAPLTAAVARENVFGCQFHPEKSGNVGLEILSAFAKV